MTEQILLWPVTESGIHMLYRQVVRGGGELFFHQLSFQTTDDTDGKFLFFKFWWFWFDWSIGIGLLLLVGVSFGSKTTGFTFARTSLMNRCSVLRVDQFIKISLNINVLFEKWKHYFVTFRQMFPFTPLRRIYTCGMVSNPSLWFSIKPLVVPNYLKRTYMTN